MISGGYYKSCLFDRHWKFQAAPMVKGERSLSQLVRVREDFQQLNAHMISYLSWAPNAAWIYNALNNFEKYRIWQQQ